MTSTPTRPVDNVVISTKGLQDRNTNIIAGTTVENKGKLILTFVYMSRETCSPELISSFQTSLKITRSRFKYQDRIYLFCCDNVDSSAFSLYLGLKPDF